MGYWSIIKPEATTNLIANPSFEKDTSGYAVVGSSTLARVNTEQKFGVYGLEITPSAGTTDGVKYDLTLSAGAIYTFSVYFKGSVGVPYRIYFYDNTAATILGTAAPFTGDGEWHRYSVTVTNGANTDIGVQVSKNSHASTAPFYIDALQAENKSYSTTYCDGDQPGCIWTAGAHTSTSSRSLQSAGGGRVVFLDDSDHAFQVESSVGTGMPPMELVDSEPAQGDGADHQETIIKPRIFQLAGPVSGDQHIDYHQARQNLITLLNPRGLATDQPRRIRYTVNGKTLEIEARYAGGLEKNRAKGHQEMLSLRFKAQEDSLWRREGNQAISSTSRQTITTNYVARQDETGQSDGLGTGLSAIIAPEIQGYPRALLNGLDNRLYIGHSLESGGGVDDGAGGTVADTKGLCLWDGVTYTGIGDFNGAVRALAIDTLANFIFIGGEFTDIEGTGYDRFVRYAPDTQTFSLNGGGPDDKVRAIAEANGIAYVFGEFANVGGSPRGAMASYNGTSWGDIGSVDSGAIFAAVGDGNFIYAGGSFPSLTGVANTSYLAKFNHTTATWLSVSTATIAGGFVEAVAVDSAGNLYIGGSFDTVGGLSNVTFAKFDGVSWSSSWPYGDSPFVYSIDIDSNDNVYIGTGDGLILFDGTTYTPIEPSAIAGDVYTILVRSDEDVILGGAFDYPLPGDATVTRLIRYTGQFVTSINTFVKAILQGVDGAIYYAGGFDQAGGVANTSYLAKWMNESWSALGTGPNGVVNALAEAATGAIALGGGFTQAGGVANTTGVALLTGGSTYTAFGTGINGIVHALAYAPNGDLYIGGFFADAGGQANTANFTKWDATNFVYLGQNVVTGTVLAFTFDLAGKLYLGGLFTTNSGAISNLALYNPTLDTFQVAAAGTIDGAVRALSTGPAGEIYIGGDFTVIGNQSIPYIAKLQGTSLSGLGAGVNGPVTALDVGTDGRLIVGGLFGQAGGVPVPDRGAVWSGSTWSPLGIDLPYVSHLEAVLRTPTETYLGFDTKGTASVSGVTTVTNNGDADTYPIIRFTGPGRLYEVVNKTTGKAIYFNLNLQSGEVAVLDLRPGKKSFVSSYQRPIQSSINPGSNIGDFVLIPGDNNISIFIGDATAEAVIIWVERFMSFDGVVV